MGIPDELTKKALDLIHVKSQIVVNAESEASQGGHYLKGCFGGFPEVEGQEKEPYPWLAEACAGGNSPIYGRVRRPFLLQGTDIPVAPAMKNKPPTSDMKKLYVQTAKSRYNGDLCYGRCATFAFSVKDGIVEKLPRSNPQWEKKNGRILDPDRMKKEWFDVWRKSALRDKPTEWPSYHGGYPRFIDGEWWLGESCAYRRHFDCVGFIDYLYFLCTRNDAATCQISIPQWVSSGKGVGSSRSPKRWNDQTDFERCDLLLNFTRPHIALLIANQGDTVIHAYHDKVGVIKHGYKNEYTDRGRMEAHYLIKGR